VFEGEFQPCDCATCLRKNARKKPFKKSAFVRSRKRAYRIHSDLKEWPVRSKKGFKYSICFVCDATRRGRAYPLKTKDAALEAFKRFIEEECAPRGLTVCVLRSDNGGEYIGKEFCVWCRSHKIRREYSPPMCQSANGISENYWREVARNVRAILWDQQRGDEWWPAALNFSNEIRNHLDSDAVDGSGIPEVEWLGGAAVDTSHWRVPLCTTWSFVEKDKRPGGTLGDQRRKGVLVGYAKESKCYMVYTDDDSAVFNRRYEDVVFDQREHAPSDTRRVRSTLDTIAEGSDGDDESGSDVSVSDEDVENDTIAAESAEKGTSNTNASLVHEPAIPSTFKHHGEEFMTMTKARKVKELADLFACDPLEYLSLLRQYDGWYQELKTIESVVKSGADVPVPQQAVVFKQSLRVPKARVVGGRRRADRKTPAACDNEADETVGLAGGSSSTKVPRRSLRQRALDEAQKDATALLALAVDFERQAVAESKAPRMREPAPESGHETAFFIAESTADEGGAVSTPTFTAKETLRSWSEASVCTTASSTALYTDEPHDQVYFQALAAGQLTESGLLDPNAPAPKSQKKAHAGEHRRQWLESEEREWVGLWNKGAFQDVPYTGQRLHHLLWVYKVKSSGLPKSRLCADGRQQDPTTYGDIASPTMRTTSFRLLLALAALNGWGVWADDVQQAFLEAERPADKPLWASYPSTFCSPPTGSNNNGRGDRSAWGSKTRCLLVLRQLYGLHNAPMGFFNTLRTHLLEDQGFVQSLNDRCLFCKYTDGSASEKARLEALEKANIEGDEPYPAPVVFGDVAVIVTVHVDDFASTGNDSAVAEYRRQLHERFPCTGGPIGEYYGLDVEVDRKRRVTRLSAKSYIGRMLVKLGIKCVPKTKTPMHEDLELPKLAGPCTNKKLHSRYRTVVGCVLHAAITARPDVGATARALSAHLQHPGEKHLVAALRAVYYLATTRELALTYGLYPEESGFYGTCDASFATAEGAKGITGWAFHLGGGAVCWKSRAQSLVSLSSTEAELIAVDEASRELRYLEKLLADLGVPAPRPTPIGQDNLSTCTLVGSTHFNPRTRHVALRYHHTGSLQRAGVLQVRYLPTEHMQSDLLTKGVAVGLHQRHTAVLMGLAKLDWARRVREKEEQKQQK
jgi:hypothetical protein